MKGCLIAVDHAELAREGVPRSVDKHITALIIFTTVTVHDRSKKAGLTDCPSRGIDTRDSGYPHMQDIQHMQGELGHAVVFLSPILVVVILRLGR